MRAHLKQLILAMFIFGWVTYPWWFFDYYSPHPQEDYAYPASFSGPKDPHYGFWYW
jgi:hypothetical protein